MGLCNWKIQLNTSHFITDIIWTYFHSSRPPKDLCNDTSTSITRPINIPSSLTGLQKLMVCSWVRDTCSKIWRQCDKGKRSCLSTVATAIFQKLSHSEQGNGAFLSLCFSASVNCLTDILYTATPPPAQPSRIGQIKQKRLTSSSSCRHFLRCWTWARPSPCCWAGFAAFSSSVTCPPRRRLASAGCGNELVVLIFPVNLWYSEAMVQVRALRNCLKHDRAADESPDFSGVRVFFDDRQFSPPEKRQKVI